MLLTGSSLVIAHGQKHLLHVVQPKLAKVVLLQRVELTRRDLVALEGILLRQERAHILDEGSRDGGGPPY
jgi:hypothetical protein